MPPKACTNNELRQCIHCKSMNKKVRVSQGNATTSTIIEEHFRNQQKYGKQNSTIQHKRLKNLKEDFLHEFEVAHLPPGFVFQIHDCTNTCQEEPQQQAKVPHTKTKFGIKGYLSIFDLSRCPFPKEHKEAFFGQLRTPNSISTKNI